MNGWTGGQIREGDEHADRQTAALMNTWAK